MDWNEDLTITGDHFYSLQHPYPTDGVFEYSTAKDYFKIKNPDIESRIEAMELLFESSALGCPEAQYEVGMRYILGKGLLKDPNEGAKWLRKAELNCLSNVGEPLDNTELIQKMSDGFEKFKKLMMKIETGNE